MDTAAVEGKTDDGTDVDSLHQLGHYEVGEKIGQGGMAVVYKGIQPSLNRTVAIKVLPQQFASTPELLQRFEREASIIAGLNHSNIVQVIDRGKERDVLYIVMEYVDGDSLDKLIKKGELTTQQIINYGMQVCDGLDYAHSMGVVHRDLKPANIIIDGRTGRVKIADFGIAAIETTGGMLATLTYDNVAIGTMNYMSPEQRVDAHRVTHLADVFSFGVILYEMLTGKIPIGHFKLPSFLRPDIPIGFDGIVKKCLSESASDRYQNAGAIRTELSRLTSYQTRGNVAGISVFKRLNKRQRWIALGGAVALAFLLAAGVGLTISRNGGEGASHGVANSAANGAAAVVVGHDEPDKQEDKPSTELMEAKLQANLARAQGFISAGNSAEAIPILAALIKENAGSPLLPEFQFALASACYDANEKEKCKIEFARVIRNFPDSPRVPEAIIGKCQAEWDTAPKKRKLLGGFEYEAALQQRLLDELKELLEKDGQASHVPRVLRLVADIARPDQLKDSKAAADALRQLYELQPSSGPDSVFHAAQLYDKEVGDAALAIATYERYLTDFPNDSRADKTRERVSVLKAPPEGSKKSDAAQ